MIKYNLICCQEHDFEAWFSSSSDYDAQREKRLVNCPHCGTSKVQKAIMAPNVSTSRHKQSAKTQQLKSISKAAAALAVKVKEDIAQNCEDVGDRFSDEARAIHYGEKPERGIYGQATLKEAKALIEEGVQIKALPDALRPKPKKKLN